MRINHNYVTNGIDGSGEITQQTIYSTLLDAMRLKVPELIRHFDDNLRPKASNCSIVLWTLLRPKASDLRRIQYDSELKRPKASKKRRIQYD